MKKLDYNSIACMVANGEVNYVAFVMTPWHMIGAKAAINYLEQKGVEVKPLIVATPHPETGFAVIKDDKYTIYELEKPFAPTNIIGYISFLFWCWRTAAKKEADLYFANAWYGKFKRIFWILSKQRRNFKIIIFEEGIGTYYKEHYTLKNNLIKRNLIQKLQLWVDLNLSKLFLKKGRIINLNPFKFGANGRLTLNETAVSMYKRTLHIEPIPLNDRRIVFLTQELDEEIYNVVNNVTHSLSSNGFEVYIKAHPRFPVDCEKITSGAKLLEYSVAIESVLQDIQTKYVVSFNTTSLMSLRYLYDVTAISMLHLVNDNCCQGMFSCQGEFNMWFEKTCEGMVLFPKDLNEFLDLLRVNNN